MEKGEWGAVNVQHPEPPGDYEQLSNSGKYIYMHNICRRDNKQQKIKKL